MQSVWTDLVLRQVVIIIDWTNITYLVVSPTLKNRSQNRNLPQIRVKIKNIWNHHPVTSWWFPQLQHFFETSHRAATSSHGRWLGVQLGLTDTRGSSIGQVHVQENDEKITWKPIHSPSSALWLIHNMCQGRWTPYVGMVIPPLKGILRMGISTPTIGLMTMHTTIWKYWEFRSDRTHR